MPESLLEGVRVLDATAEPGHLGGRILADLGAEVVKLEPAGGDPLRRVAPFVRTGGEAAARTQPSEAVPRSLRFEAWNAGKASCVVDASPTAAPSPGLLALLEGANVVLDTPGWPGAVALDPSLTAPASQAVWVRITPFGMQGPRAHWHASDLGVVASSGNQHATGYPDRPPLRSTEPAAYAHCGPEIAVAALTGLASGRPQIIDLSMQECMLVANMGAVAEQNVARDRGTRRAGATLLGMKEIWRCRDGWISFGLRGGVARAPTYEHMTRILAQEGIDAPAWQGRDWQRFNIHELGDAERRAIETPLEQYFAQHTMQELYDRAAELDLLLATCNTPRELAHSPQLAARAVLGRLGDLDGFPLHLARVEDPEGRVERPAPRQPAPHRPGADPLPRWSTRSTGPQAAAGASVEKAAARPRRDGPWQGTLIVELGSGAAGPIASRYFAEHGATVIKIESKTRPEFLRTMAVAAGREHGLEGDPIFNALNAGKQSVTLNLKHAEGNALARRLMLSADLVLENFAPGAMARLGLDYATLAKDAPTLRMVSTCMNGQTGPHRSYPGFGSQGSALAGYTHLTGFPDRAPVGPYGTITDSIAPRFAATAMASALLYGRRTGRGVYLDLSQVETAVYTLAPWMLDWSCNGVVGQPLGNRSPRMAPHGVFPCRPDHGGDGSEDAWIAIAAASDEEWRQLAAAAGIADLRFERLAGRKQHEDELEAALSRWTAAQDALELAERLQALAIEAVPVQSFPQVFDDPQLAARDHFERHEHGARGALLYERNGFRLSDAGHGYAGPAPLLGEHTRPVLRDLLGVTGDEIDRLTAAGAVE